MASSQAVTSAVVTSPSFVIVPRADALPKLVWGIAILLFGIAFFVALMVFLSAVLPGVRERARASLKLHPVQTFLCGLLGFGLLGALGAFLYSQSRIELLLRTEYVPSMLGGAIAVGVVVVLGTVLGGMGVIQALGERLEQLNQRDMSGLRKTAWAALLLALASLFPGIGWAIVLPLALMLAFGAILRGLLPMHGR